MNQNCDSTRSARTSLALLLLALLLAAEVLSIWFFWAKLFMLASLPAAPIILMRVRKRRQAALRLA